MSKHKKPSPNKLDPAVIGWQRMEENDDVKVVPSKDSAPLLKLSIEKLQALPRPTLEALYDMVTEPEMLLVDDYDGSWERVAAAYNGPWQTGGRKTKARDRRQRKLDEFEAFLR